MFGGWSSKKADIPIDLVILMIAGLTMVIAGLLLFPVYSGLLPYYENGLYGLLIFIYALQITVLGKTPFGDVPQRPLALLILGVIVACVGIITCFIPDILKNLPRKILFICFGPGGILLLMQMFLSKNKFSLWKEKGGIFHLLAVNCAAVYSMSVFISLLLIDKNIMTGNLTAFSVLFYGILILSLTAVLFRIYEIYPAAAERPSGVVQLSDDRTVILITGVFMVLLGILLVPVTIGLLPFSGSAQLGLLVVIMSIQMVAFGNTPIRSFSRTWPLVWLGLFFGALGIISCIIPWILVPTLTFIIALLNIGGGTIPIIKVFLSKSPDKGTDRGTVPTVIKRLFMTQMTLNTLSIVFGTSMLIKNLIPGPVIGVVLASNGIVLLYLLSILARIDKMKKTLV